ncbi:50S ribosomal protein L11 methyltransferase [Rhodohalobacter mucosus]|uniref:Ribosomal protein L11 methyltransferase n=1 Tax=Rhodohalobacter mucosus TaxID=2079485 RepID=A0A316TWT0_9BACT|nr:50S ribosomal protein L11 methyltransferase [Rhodohalobacter mucosus]PWN07022.1 50S ribosomal protein L11 methyltransferase [Rhodohalobacter mucosus]
MTYIKLIFDIDEEYQEMIIAELMDLDFYGFEQEDERLIAYVEQPRYNDAHREYIEQIIAAFPGASFYEAESIPEQNWNETWEKSIRPQVIGEFLVRPTWSEAMPEEGQMLLEIDPKMAFGTGYHATTRLVLNELSNIPLKNREILDAGTGTAILAIAAAKLGAARVLGFDIDPWSRDNAVENIYLNDVAGLVEFRFGGMEVVDDHEKFDVILANINRNAILELLPSFLGHARPAAVLILSGLLHTDELKLRDTLEDLPVKINGVTREEEWICFRITKI